MSNVSMTILGEPCSKANSRRLVTSKTGRPLFIKSQKALDYVKSFEKQCKKLDPLLLEDVAVTIKIDDVNMISTFTEANWIEASAFDHRPPGS